MGTITREALFHFHISFLNSFTTKKQTRKWSIQAMSFRLNPFHANYILKGYKMSYMYMNLNKILFKPKADNKIFICKFSKNLSPSYIILRIQKPEDKQSRSR